MSNQQISCPNCHFEFSIETVLSQQIEAQLRAQHQQEALEQQKHLDAVRTALEAEKAQLEQQAQTQKATFIEQLQSAIEKEKSALAKQAQSDAERAAAAKMTYLQNELEKSEREKKQLQTLEVEKLKLEQQLRNSNEDHQRALEKQALELQQKLEQDIREKATQDAEAKHLQQRLELEKKLEDQQKLAQEMQRKAEQGSMQLQGEVIELEVQRQLERQFPLDQFTEVSKGARGADIVQQIQSHGLAIGEIIYETKSTKNFQQTWIDKLKEDMRRHGGVVIGVIVTQAMPKDMPRFGERDGIWICQLQELNGLSYVLREMMLREHQAREAQNNRDDKVHLLYDYLTGSEFAQRVEAIVEGFSTMKADIDSERRAMERLWKSREKQIEKVINNTIDMYGSIRGIGGSSVPSVPALELGNTALDDL